MVRIIAVLTLVAALLPPASALAVNPDEMLDDPALEERAREISAELRCLVCQNQSIDDSNADLAKDLRVLVRERLTEGDSNSEVIDFVVDRYGEFVLLNPRFDLHTLGLWLAPPIVLGLGAIAVFFALRRRRIVPAGEAAPLSDDEQKRLAEILSDKR